MDKYQNLTAETIPGDCGGPQPGGVEADGTGAGEGVVLGAAAAVEVDARWLGRRRLGSICL